MCLNQCGQSITELPGTTAIVTAMVYVLCICGSAKPDMLCFQGKSAVWSHLLSFQEVIECNETSNPIDPKMLTPGGLCHWLFSLGLGIVMLTSF